MKQIKDISALNDLEIIALYINTNEKSYVGELYKRYTSFVFLISMKYLKNVDESKDAVMQIFEKLFSALLKYNISNFKSWLHTVTRNHCLLQLRKKTYTQKMFSLPQKLFNNSICKIHKILWAKLPNESKTKTIIGIARGFCKQTYNLEVEKTHCLMANGVVAHNCSYALADINPIKEIVMPRPSGQRNRPKVNLGL